MYVEHLMHCLRIYHCTTNRICHKNEYRGCFENWIQYIYIYICVCVCDQLPDMACFGRNWNYRKQHSKFVL